MNPIKNYPYAPVEKEIPSFGRGFALAVVIILVAVIVIIAGLVQGFRQTTYYASARMVYLAAGYVAMESMASGHYHVPVQEDLRGLLGEEINEEAIITVVDENQDATIDYIVFVKNGLVTRYMPGNIVVTSE